MRLHGAAASAPVAALVPSQTAAAGLVPSQTAAAMCPPVHGCGLHLHAALPARPALVQPDDCLPDRRLTGCAAACWLPADKRLDQLNCCRCVKGQRSLQPPDIVQAWPEAGWDLQAPSEGLRRLEHLGRPPRKELMHCALQGYLALTSHMIVRAAHAAAAAAETGQPACRGHCTITSACALVAALTQTVQEQHPANSASTGRQQSSALPAQCTLERAVAAASGPVRPSMTAPSRGVPP